MRSQSLRALVVDDEKPLRFLTANALAAENIVCDQAASGHDAAAMLEGGRYDLVVTDLKMPNGHGHALCQAVLERSIRPLLVVVTGINEPRLFRDLEARGVDAIFRKPLNFSSFAERVKVLLDERLALAEAVGIGPAAGETSIASELPPAESPRQMTVAILLQESRRAQRLASGLAAASLKVLVPETTDALCHFVAEQTIDVILIEDARYGFLGGAEILSRLRSSGARSETILIGDATAFTPDQTRALHIRKIFSYEATESDLIQSVRSALVDCERASARISPTARALVKPYSAPAHSPLVLLKLATYLQMPPAEIPMPQLARDILLNPATAAELLRLSNGSTDAGVPITEVVEALNLLGASRAVVLLLASGIRNVERGLFRKIAADLLGWYQLRTILIATVASVFAEKHYAISGDKAFVLGLFQEMGVLVLANAFGDRYSKLIQHARTVGPVRLHAIEQQSLHVNHAQVSAAIMEQWRLPEALVEPVRCHHEASTLAPDGEDLTSYLQVMRIGDAFADLWENRHPTRTETMSRLLADCPRPGGVDSHESLEEAVRRSADYSKLFRLPVPDENDALAVCREILTSYGETHREPGAAAPSDSPRHVDVE